MQRSDMNNIDLPGVLEDGTSSLSSSFAPPPKNLRRMTILTLICLVNLSMFMGFSQMAPFFPKEADKKHVTPLVSGFIFSVYPLVMMFSCPVIGKALPHIGIKFTLLSGIFVTGIANALFGVLDKIEDMTTFAVYCFLVRATAAVGTGKLRSISECTKA